VPRSHPLAGAALCLLILVGSAAADEALRVVSLNPSLTQTLLAVGAEETLVGVDEYSARIEPRVRALPRVGGLFNPSLEAIVALQPSFVALVPSAQQRALRERLAALDIEVLALANHSFEEVLRSMEILGERVGRGAAAHTRVGEIREAWRAAEARADATPRVSAVLVLQRDPLYVVGGGSYLDAMLRAAGAENAASGFGNAYPRVSVEWLIEAAPELILDAADPPGAARAYWSRWPSLPAVAGDRVRVIDERVTLPGPYLDRALARLEARVHEATPPPEPPAAP
jgi:ABC-type Fe3+-hydroxamate transport system substrate-binding protein